MEENTTTTNNNAGIQPETVAFTERTDALIKRLEEANKKSEELLKKNEEVLSRILLSGRSNAGTTQVAVDPKQEQADRLNKMFKGTGLKIV